MVFKKGYDENRNLDGRPEGSLSITILVRKALAEKPEGEDGKTYVEQFVQKLLDQAIKKGDTTTQKMIWNYIDGLPRETLDHTVHLVKPLATIDDLRKDDSHEEDSKLNQKN